MVNVEIDLGEKFKHLPRAPIVEAVIDIRARASVDLDEEHLRLQIEASLPGYHFLDSHQEIQQEIKVEAGQPLSQTIRFDWKGLRFRSEDEKYIAQFNRDGLVFSRLEPYQDWAQLHSEAMKLWLVYMEVAQPLAIDRLGLRFINQIRLPVSEFQLEDYLKSAPQPPVGLDVPFANFMHQDTLTVSGHPYVINVIKATQPFAVGEHPGNALILDIDVLATKTYALENGAELKRHFLEMRWLKNKVFFGSLNDKALLLFE
jgi:hypothetical protein